MDRPDFPTMDQVEKADREQLARCIDSSRLAIRLISGKSSIG